MPDHEIPQIEKICTEHGMLAVYLFGPRADDGLAVLQGGEPKPGNAALTTGIVFPGSEPKIPHDRLDAIRADLVQALSPIPVEIVLLQNLDPLPEWEAINDHRVAASDPVGADYYELYVARRAAESRYFRRQDQQDQERLRKRNEEILAKVPNVPPVPGDER